jgi:hypothetical protein
VYAAGDYLYFADGNLFRAANISRPLEPVMCEPVYTADTITGICMDGGYAYLSSRQRWIKVLDVRQPSKIIDQGETIPVPDFPNAVCADGDYLFVADHREGLVILKRTMGDRKTL